MEKATAEKYLEILELSRTDHRYLEYYHSYQVLNDEMCELFEKISADDSMLIADYFGLREAMMSRLLEMACERMEFR